MKTLFEKTPGFGDVCMEKFERYPSIETLERSDVRPKNVRKLTVDTGVNPITHDVRVNYAEWRRIMIEIDIRLDNVLPFDGVQWLIATLCGHLDPSNKSSWIFIVIHYVIFVEMLHIYANVINAIAVR